MFKTLEINIPIRAVRITGDLVIPKDAFSLVIFAHGSGSSRFSVRNKYVAGILNQAGFATLLVDLLTPEEDKIYANRFDIDMLTDRLVEATAYVRRIPALNGFTIGYFGASTGAASALRAAECLPDQISAVVSRGGRPDLAAGALPRVKAPVLLIVGSHDKDVITLNRRAFQMLRCEKQLSLVEGASHLFEEPGTLARAAELATQWFENHLHHEAPVLLHNKS